VGDMDTRAAEGEPSKDDAERSRESALSKLKKELASNPTRYSSHHDLLSSFRSNKGGERKETPPIRAVVVPTSRGRASLADTMIISAQSRNESDEKARDVPPIVLPAASRTEKKKKARDKKEKKKRKKGR
jgi:hypothetical protein